MVILGLYTTSTKKLTQMHEFFQKFQRIASISPFYNFTKRLN